MSSASLDTEKDTPEKTTTTMPPSNKGNTTPNAAASSFKLLLLVLMVLQNSSTVLVGRHSRSSVAEQDLYVVNHLILITEAGKVCMNRY